MDDFTTCGIKFEEALTNLGNVIEICEEYNLYLNNEKCFIMMQEGVVLEHYISQVGIQVDPAKIEVILNLSIPTKKKYVKIFLVHTRYYRRFIKDFSRMAGPL